MLGAIKQKIKDLFCNPKTSWSGVAVASLQVALVFGLITPEQSAALSGLATAFGLLVARDHDKTGAVCGPEPEKN